jgi:UDP-glucose 4-epimerase
MEHDNRYRKILALDVREPFRIGRRTQYCHIDLTSPEAGQELAELFRAQQVDGLVHLAFLSSPIHDAAYAHELQAIGTMHLLNAASAAGLSKVVMLGTTMSYGARPDNPNFLLEDAPLQGVPGCAQVSDLIEAEKEAWEFSRKNPGTVVTVLRMASMLGANVDGFMARLLSRSTVPTVMGYDPLLQFVHEVDALDALKRAVDQDHPGAFNIAADGVLPYSTVLRLGGRIPLPVPAFLVNRLGGFLWALQATETPPCFLDYLRYLWVTDSAKAKTDLGFAPKYTSRETLLTFIRLGRLRRTPLLPEEG